MSLILSLGSPKLWFSSSWSINTWSRMKLSSSFCRLLSGLKTRGCRPSLDPVVSWWLKIISRSHSSMNAWRKRWESETIVAWMTIAQAHLSYKGQIKELTCSLTGVLTFDKHCWHTARKDLTTLRSARRSSWNQRKYLCFLVESCNNQFMNTPLMLVQPSHIQYYISHSITTLLQPQQFLRNYFVWWKNNVFINIIFYLLGFILWNLLRKQ